MSEIQSSAPTLDKGPGTGSEYAELSRRVKQAGLLKRRAGYYTMKIAAMLLLLVGCWAAVIILGNTWWQVGTAAVLAVVCAQVAFIGHDAGHRQIFQKRGGNDALGIVLANLLSGMSFGWWVGKHNRHHANPNHVGKDPDIGAGALVFTRDQAGERRGVAKVVTRIQSYLFFPMLLLEGLNLHYASVVGLIKERIHQRPLEAVLLTIHGIAYVGILLAVMSPVHALVFFAVHKGVFGFYMGCSFAPNHKGMPTPTEEEERSFLRKQVVTSRNIRGGWLVDFALGGLNYQIEHHLFPSMPRPNLRRAQSLVREFCKERGVPYAETSLVRSYAAVLHHLHDVAEPLRLSPISSS